MKHPSWANYIVVKRGSHYKFYLDKLEDGYRYIETGITDKHPGFISNPDHGDAILRNMISYEFIGEEEN